LAHGVISITFDPAYMTIIIPRSLPFPRALAICVLTSAFVVGCTSSSRLRHEESLLPVVVLEQEDSTEVWGRVLIASDDSLIIRRLEDQRPILVNPHTVTAAYLVQRGPTNYPLSLSAAVLVLAGSCGVAAAVNEGNATSGMFLIAGAAGILPATFAAVQVSDWTRKYRITPLQVIGPDGRLDLRRFRAEISKPATQ